MKRLLIAVLFLGLLTLLHGQEQKDQKSKKVVAKAKEQVQPDSAEASKLSPHPTGKDRGVGPITELNLGPIDPKLAAEGQSLFDSKCVACHSLDQRKIGPALGTISDQRTPAFIMNMLLATQKMEQKDPEVEQLVSKYHIQMPDVGVTQQQARAILEYLRQSAVPKPKK